jgi:hypothetical protein
MFQVVAEKNRTTHLGERRLVRRSLPPGYRIERVTASFAYARNGNAGNPTAEYRWEVFCGDARVGSAYREGKAVDLAREHSKDPR